MVIYTELKTDAVVRSFAYNLSVKKTIGESNSSSAFEAIFDNTAGVNDNTFDINDEVEIRVGSVDPPTTLIFKGVIEDIQHQAHHLKEMVSITGRDYMVRLMDETVEPSVYNNLEAGSIVKSLIANYTQDITTTNVNTTSKTITHITFNHTPVFDAIKKLADLAGYFFYVDTDKDLNFKESGSNESNLTLNNTNTHSLDIRHSDYDLANKVWVYGGRQLTGWRETFTANGAGSTFTLTYNPHDTEVLVAGSTQPKKGGIFELHETVISGVEYLVDFDQKKIIFISGTTPGNFIPGSTNSVAVNYQRSTPIIKYGEDRASIAAYGPHSKVIVDKNIVDPQQAKDILIDTLKRQSLPLTLGNIHFNDIQDLDPGDSVTVTLPFVNVSGLKYEVIETNYDFNPINNREERVMSARVNRRIDDYNDTMKEVILTLRKLEAEDAIDTDVISRLEFGAGSYEPDVKSWYVYTRTLGSSFVLNSPLYGDLGSGTDQVAPQTYLGDSRGALVSQYSGGRWN